MQGFGNEFLRGIYIGAKCMKTSLEDIPKHVIFACFSILLYIAFILCLPFTIRHVFNKLKIPLPKNRVPFSANGLSLKEIIGHRSVEFFFINLAESILVLEEVTYH